MQVEASSASSSDRNPQGKNAMPIVRFFCDGATWWGKLTVAVTLPPHDYITEREITEGL